MYFFSFTVLRVRPRTKYAAPKTESLGERKRPSTVTRMLALWVGW